MQISEVQHKVAGDLIDLVVSLLGSGRAVHPQTAIASVARLAGSLLLRSFNLNIQALEPGAVVLSDEANEGGRELVSIMFAMLQAFGISIDGAALGQDQAEHGAEPNLSVLQSLSLLQQPAMAIARTNGLALKEAAQAAALATAFMVKECARDIGAERGVSVATYGFIEGCKTVPPPLDSKSQAGDKKPWYKLW